MMNEVKTPQETADFFTTSLQWVILLAINLFTVPWLAQRQVKEVDYGTFLQMAEDKDLGPGGGAGDREPDYLYQQGRDRHF